MDMHMHMQVEMVVPAAVWKTMKGCFLLLRYIYASQDEQAEILLEVVVLAVSIIGALWRKTMAVLAVCIIGTLGRKTMEALWRNRQAKISLEVLLAVSIADALWRKGWFIWHIYGSQNQRAEIVSRVQNQLAEIFSRVQNQLAEIFSRVQNQQEILSKEGLLSESGKMNIINLVLQDAAGKDSIGFNRMKMEGSYIQCRLQNQQAEMLREGLLSEPVNIDAAHACVVTPSGELQTDELTRVNVYRENAPSVVLISNMARQGVFHLAEQGYGTGFVWDDKGHIVTNFHVICGAYVLRVIFDDKSACEATVIGCHPDTDIAVLSIVDLHKLKKLRPVRVGSSKNLKVGQNVYAIGNPFHLQSTLTTGVIGALGRQIKSSTTDCPIPDVIQITAAINPGNSGGPLFDSSGSLIGINTSFQSSPRASGGIAFAIPVDIVSSIVDQLVKNESVMRDPYCTRSISGAA